MGLFRRRSKQDAASLADRFVEAATPADPALEAGVAAVSEGHLAAGVVLLGETRNDPELRSHRASTLAEAAIGRGTEIGELAQAERDNPDLWLWLGETIIQEAWAIRGGGYASSVGEDRFKVFWSTLKTAHEPLQQAARLAPQDAVPWESRMWLALGMQLGRAESDEIWRELVARCPTLWMGHWARLQTLCAKWQGSHEEMYEFARDTVRRAPAGNLLAGMLPLAHFEYWMQEEQRLLDAGKGTMALLKQELKLFGGENVAEVKAADDKWRDGMRPHLYDIGAHHLFGGFYARCLDEDGRARWHLSRVGNRVAGTPWNHDVGSAIENFAEVLLKLKLPIPPPPD